MAVITPHFIEGQVPRLELKLLNFVACIKLLQNRAGGVDTGLFIGALHQATAIKAMIPALISSFVTNPED